MYISCTVPIFTGNKWLQQQIPACRPVFTAKHVFFVFVGTGVIFVALGILFVVVTLRVCTRAVTVYRISPTVHVWCVSGKCIKGALNY